LDSDDPDPDDPESDDPDSDDPDPELKEMGTSCEFSGG
jgi:hypothetical protein